MCLVSSVSVTEAQVLLNKANRTFNFGMNTVLSDSLVTRPLVNDSTFTNLENILATISDTVIVQKKDHQEVDTLTVEGALKLLDEMNVESEELKKEISEGVKVLQGKVDSLVVATDTLAVPVDSSRVDSIIPKHRPVIATRPHKVDSIPVVPKKKKKRRPNPIYLKIDSVRNAYTDFLKEKSVSFHAHLRLWDDLNLPDPRHIRPNPDFYKLIVPPTYYTGVVEQAFGVDWTPQKSLQKSASDSLYQVKAVPGYELADLQSSQKVDRWINALLLNYYMEHPASVTGNEVLMNELPSINDEQLEVKERKEKILSFLEAEEPIEKVEKKELVVYRPNFWKTSGNGYAQFTQQYISDNWYQGGESTNSLLSGITLKAKYDDRQRLEFENSLEIKLGFVTAPSDTVHHYKTNADLFRLNSKLGIRAVKNWYYTLATELKTQFFANYRTNTNDMNSAFLSPLQLTVNVGMDFKQQKPKYDISLLASPFAYTLVYIGNDKIVNPRAFNVEDGKRSANMFGSKFTGNLTWKIIPTVTWKAMFEYFTTYEKVIASWENTFNFTLNRYLSAKLFLHARFDDGVKLTEENNTHFQFQQLLSFGLNYTW